MKPVLVSGADKPHQNRSGILSQNEDFGHGNTNSLIQRKSPLVPHLDSLIYPTVFIRPCHSAPPNPVSGIASNLPARFSKSIVECSTKMQRNTAVNTAETFLPNKKKTRASVACVNCNYRKIRCDAVLIGCPCTNCKHDDLVCTPYQRKRARSASRSHHASRLIIPAMPTKREQSQTSCFTKLTGCARCKF